MISLSLRLNKRRLSLCLLTAAAIVGAAAAAVGFFGKATAASSTVEASGETLSLAKTKLKSQEEQIQFLLSLGWEVQAEPLEITQVLIPSELDEVYTRYNDIQLEQGLDLTDYQGKTAKRYTYCVTNYPGLKENVQADLIVYKEKLIAADICWTDAQDGFLHSLAMPAELENAS